MKIFSLLLLLVFLQPTYGNPENQEKNGITLKRLFIDGTALDAGEAIIYYTSLKRENIIVKSKKLDLIMDHLEIQFIHYIVKLNFIVHNYSEEDSVGARRTLNRIIVGIRQGYINLDRYIKTERCTILLDDFIDVPLKDIYNSVQIPKEEESKYIKWFEKYGTK